MKQVIVDLYLFQKNALWKNMKFKNPYSLLMLAGIHRMCFTSVQWMAKSKE